MTGIGVGSRSTWQREAVVDVLAHAHGFKSAQQLHAMLAERGTRIGIATVYRSLQLLADAGLVDVIHSEDGEAAYRQCSPRHHHHLVCRECGKAVEAESPDVERFVEALAAEHGFADVSHDLEIFGCCADCARRTPS